MSTEKGTLGRDSSGEHKAERSGPKEGSEQGPRVTEFGFNHTYTSCVTLGESLDGSASLS